MKCIDTNFIKTTQQFGTNTNINGFPSSKSSSSQVYSISIQIKGISAAVIVGIYHVYQKPSETNELFQDFVEEIITLVNNGFYVHHKHLDVAINCIISDVPAKSYVKYIRSHSGYSSFTKCQINGELSDKIYFPEIKNSILRTDALLGAKQDEDHHIGFYILENIPGLDMIKRFPKPSLKIPF